MDTNNDTAQTVTLDFVLKTWTITRLTTLIGQEPFSPWIADGARALAVMIETEVGTEMGVDHPALAAVEWSGQMLDDLDWH